MRTTKFLLIGFALAAAVLYFVVVRARRVPNVVVIVVDTLRADRVGANGNPRGLTPFFDELARQGTTFVNAYATSSWTYPSVASLLTSRYPSQHRVTGYDSVLAADELTLGELLAERGYAGAGFSANFRVSEANGYAQGFKLWEAFLPPPGQSKPRGPLLKERVLSWLTARPRSDSSPTFLYLQYMEPHSPYEPPEPYQSRFASPPPGFNSQIAQKKMLQVMGKGTRGLSPDDIAGLASLYDAEVAAADAEVRALFEELRTKGLLDHAIIVITADHGEEFGEHGELLHGRTLYQPAVRIPLIIVAPGLSGGRIVSENVSLVDLAPTILDLIGLPSVPGFEGRSLVPFMRDATSRGTKAPAGEALVELERYGEKWDSFRAHANALVRDNHKVIVPRWGDGVGFDLARDPAESSPEIVPGGEVTTAILKRLEERRADLQKRAATTSQVRPLDEDTKEKLRALGYHP